MRPVYKMTMETSRIRASEPDWRVLPKVLSNEYPVICCHPTGAGSWMSWVSPNTYAQAALPPQLAIKAGVASMGGWMGGDTFGNDLGVSCVEQTRLHLASIPGINASKVHLIGVSQGAALAIRYAGLNPSKVASFTGVIPLADTQAVYAADRLGLRASIASAWGVTSPAPLPATAQPITHAPALVAAGIPSRLYGSPSDQAILPTEVAALANALNIPVISVDGTTIPGHSEQSVLDAATRNSYDMWTEWISWIQSV